MKKSKDKALHKEARKISIKEGSISSITSGLGDSYISAFMVQLTKSPLPIGFLSSFPGLLSPIAQMFGSKFMERRSRKSIVVSFIFLQALMWFPIALIAVLYLNGILTEASPYLLITFYSMLAFFGGMAGPAWFSWMGDIVSDEERGKYFSRRNRIAGIVSVSAFLLGAFILDFTTTKGMVMIGFIILFTIAGSARLVAYTFFKKQHHPEFKLEKKYYFTFYQFITRYGNFLKFSLFQAFFYFAIMIAGPFFTVYMLDNLKFNYITYTLVSISSTFFYLFFLPLAGRFSDKYGNVKMMIFSSILFSLYPFLWLFFKNPIYIVLVPQLLVGIASAGFAISTTNFIYETVTPQRRGICSAYMSLLVGFGVFFGALAGGLLVKYAPRSWMEPVLFAFLISSILRLSVTLIFSLQIKEKVRKTRTSIPKLNILNWIKMVTGEGRGILENIQQSFLSRFSFYKKRNSKDLKGRKGE